MRISDWRSDVCSSDLSFAESEEGEGTSFAIYLPVHRAETRKRAAQAPETKGELWGTGTVLLVEDEAMVRAVAERALTRHGYKVLTAENGEAARAILAREEKDALMITDVVLPTTEVPTTHPQARKQHPNRPHLYTSATAEQTNGEPERE